VQAALKRHSPATDAGRPGEQTANLHGPDDAVLPQAALETAILRRKVTRQSRQVHSYMLLPFWRSDLPSVAERFCQDIRVSNLADWCAGFVLQVRIFQPCSDCSPLGWDEQSLHYQRFRS